MARMSKTEELKATIRRREARIKLLEAALSDAEDDCERWVARVKLLEKRQQRIRTIASGAVDKLPFLVREGRKVGNH